MRQAAWHEVFAPRPAPGGLVLTPEVPQEPQGWRRLLWWEELLTFGLLGVVLLAVVSSIDRARWVDGMPSLYPIAFFGLALGALLARLRWPEGLVHLLALPVGAAASLGQILSVLPGPTPWDRYDLLHERMGDWFHAAFTGGISNDELPVVMLVVPLTWLAAYLSAWAVFRWQNVWLALSPTGTALLMNISFLPGQFSLAFVVFLLSGTLLVTRLHLLEQARGWRDSSTPYPPLLSLSVLHTTFWVALALVVLAWLMPQANEAGPLESLWRRATAPVTERAAGLSRLFVSVNSKKAFRVHDFEDILPFLGSIELPDTLTLEVTTEPLDQPRYLRAQVYEIYTPAGWQRRSQQTLSLDAGELMKVDEFLSKRLGITVRVIASGRTGNTIFAIGQPLRFDRKVQMQWNYARQQVTGVVAAGGLKRGDVYEAVGSVSIATEEDLRAAGTGYPAWVRTAYLDLPEDLPARVRRLALRLTRSASTPYDKAVAIESYLRTIPYDLDVPDTPYRRDTIDYFLFDLRRGYFDYHASAMVVMLRSLGIPSRLAVGYVLQDRERDVDTDRYRVTEASAFAWPEVYFPGLGWVEFNPTPNHPAVIRPGAEPAASSTRGAEDVPNLGIGLENLPGAFPRDGAAGAGSPTSGTADDRALWVLAGIVAGVAAIVASGAGLLRHAWVRGLAGLEPPARLWGQTVRLASWARLSPAPDMTPREYARTLREQRPGLDGAELLADAYVRYRYGRQRPDETERARLERAWRSVRASLLGRLLRLPWTRS